MPSKKTFKTDRHTFVLIRDAAGKVEIEYRCPNCKNIVIGKDQETGEEYYELKKLYKVIESCEVSLKTDMSKVIIEEEQYHDGTSDIKARLMSNKELLNKIKKIKENLEEDEELGDVDSNDSEFIGYECNLCSHEIGSLNELIVKVIKTKIKNNNQQLTAILGKNFTKNNNKEEIKEVDVDYGDIRIPGESRKIINKRWGDDILNMEPSGGVICECGNEIIVGKEDGNTEIECQKCGKIIKTETILRFLTN